LGFFSEMISPFTPPGTKIVCVMVCSSAVRHWAPIVIEREYTVRSIESGYNSGGAAYGVTLVEVHNEMHPESGKEYMYGLKSFRRRDLPICLTRFTTSNDIDVLKKLRIWERV
jgi:hypothetical protein